MDTQRSLQRFTGPFAHRQVWAAVACSLACWLLMRHLGMPLLERAWAPRPLTPGMAADLAGLSAFLGLVVALSVFRYRNWRRSRLPDTTLQEREIAFLTSLGHSKKPVE